MSFSEALSLGDREFATLIGASTRTELMFAIAHELKAIPKLVVTTAMVRFPVPKPEQCEACVVDAAAEVAYRDTIERLKYFTHVHTGLGGSGGFVTTRTDTIGRHYSPSNEGLTLALGRNQSLPYVITVGESWTAAPYELATSIPSRTRLLIPVVDASADSPSTDDIADSVAKASQKRPDARIMPYVVVGSNDDVSAAEPKAREIRDAIAGQVDERHAPSKVVIGTVREAGSSVAN